MSSELKGITEGLLFASGEEGLTKKQIALTLDVSTAEIEQLLIELNADYENEGRGMKLMRSNEIYHLTTKPEHSHYYKRLQSQGKSSRMSQAALETLAIITYQQPVTKVQIEELRGVNSDHAVKSLLKRSMIEISGRKDAPGRPYFFITSKEFLAYFGLSSLKELPSLEEFFESANAQQTLDE